MSKNITIITKNLQKLMKIRIIIINNKMINPLMIEKIKNNQEIDSIRF
jgi:hypothetical protein